MIVKMIMLRIYLFSKKKGEKVMAKRNRINVVHWILVRITALSSS
jgi:hypothetical protein